jgi:hypothetical protein
MKIKVFEPPLPDLDMVEVEAAQMNRGGGTSLSSNSKTRKLQHTEPVKMQRGGFGGIPEPRFGGPRTNNAPAQGGRRGSQGYISQQDVDRSIREAIRREQEVTGRGLQNLESRIANLDLGLTEGDVASLISQATSALPQGVTETQVQQLIEANPGITREDVIRLIRENPEVEISDVQNLIRSAVENLPEGITLSDVQRVVDANPGLTRENVLEIVRNNPGINFTDVENAINTALTGQEQQNEGRLREIAERIFQEQTGRFNQNIGGDRDEALSAEREDFINNFIRQQQSRETLTSEEINNLVQQQINAGLESGDYVQGGDVTQTIQDLIAAGTLTPDEIQRRIDAGDITKDDVLAILQGGFSFTEEQYAQLFSRGVLTRDEIAALVDAAITEADTGDDITTEDVERIAQAAGITEDQVLDLISQQLESFDPNIDTSGFATQDQLSQFATQDQLDNFATQEQIQGLESLFQNYLTPEQLQGYLPQEGQYVTPEQLAEATTGQYDEVIQGLTDKLGTLEQQYQDVQSQYEADAVESQIDQTKEDLDTFFRSSVPTGPRTGSTSQFSSGASFLPGGSPMANLIGGQRKGLGQDAFSTYLKTFTPSYGSYEEPVDPETYGQAGLPQLGIQYSNPFTGGASYSPPGNFSQGGQVTNGIMDLTNFDTNVQPFQNAFRPNVPRN